MFIPPEEKPAKKEKRQPEKTEVDIEALKRKVKKAKVSFTFQLRPVFFGLLWLPSSSSGWRYGTNGTSGSCRQPN